MSLNDRGQPLVVMDGLVKRFPGMKRPALAGVSGMAQPGSITGLVGPDGAGKTTLIRLLVGLLLPDAGQAVVAGFDTRSEAARIHPVCGYMPQKFGLYEDLNVMENLRLYADLRGLTGAARDEKFRRLLEFTSLSPFQSRLAGKLSGGMKQKLGLACALLGEPAVLFLDEPSVGVDPISRRELWKMVRALLHPGMAVIWSTSYLDEAEQCDAVMLLNEGEVLFNGPPAQSLRRVEGRVWLLEGVAESQRRAALLALQKDAAVSDVVLQGAALRVVAKDAGGICINDVDSNNMRGSAPHPARGMMPLDPHLVSVSAGSSLKSMHPAAERFGGRWREVEPRFEDAFIDILGGGPKSGSALAEHMEEKPQTDVPAIEARDLHKEFGAFVAVRGSNLRIPRGEIFGLLGPNGAGKSTIFKMLCGLLRPTSGQAAIMGIDLRKSSTRARERIGYMAQKFSLYGQISVRHNLRFFSGVYGLGGAVQKDRMEMMISLFSLAPYLGMNAETLPLGFKQRLALACAIMHQPDVLFLDEPTSGVDPVTRREFWLHINAMAQKGVTVMVTTHFMDEAEYCDRIALIYRGETIAAGSPEELKQRVRTPELPDPSLEDAFIGLVREAEY
jgi:ABC-2 type transport system ATP-binding protein